MKVPVSIFLDFSLPNATTWFYFSFLLAIALFFKFSRLFSIRNLDILTLFLLVPGLLLIQQGHQQPEAPPLRLPPTVIATLLLSGSGPSATAALTTTAQAAALMPPTADDGASSLLWVGYVCLLSVTLYLLLRCLLDLILVRRPALTANLNLGGLAWLSLALLVCLSVVAFRPVVPTAGAAVKNPSAAQHMLDAGNAPIGRTTAPLELAQTSLRPSFILMRSFAILCHLSVLVGLVLIGRWHYQDMATGMALAACYLLLPYTGYFVGQLHHVWPMALLIWAVVFYRQPTVAGVFLGLAAGTAFFPVLILPIWFGFYRRRGAARFLVSSALAAGVCLALTGWVLWLNNDLTAIIRETLALPDWQPWQWKVPRQEGFWVGVHWAYRMPVFILYLTGVIITAFWPAPKNLAHVLALSTAVLLGLQLWYSDQGGVYVLWYLPFFLLMVFRPNLSDRRPPEPPASGDWLHYLLRGLRRVGSWLVQLAWKMKRSRMNVGMRGTQPVR